MGRLLVCVLLLGTAVAAADPDLDKALARVRALEAEITKVVGKVQPTVGAVLNYGTIYDIKTGRVAMRERSLGSGVVISRDGYFLTNVHVVESAGYITVAFPDGGVYPADRHADTSSGRVKGDIAILKLRGKKSWPYADYKAGNVKRLVPGSFVFAMGNPYGHALDGNPVVTMGIISGKGRAAATSGYLYVDVIQTDAEINPGNSGGPLFDARGKLVGINGLMQSRAGRSNSGVGFAIPIDQIRLFLKKLLRRESDGVGYGYHGTDVQTAPGETGARIMRVAKQSPAAEAGLRRDDVITFVNGKRVSNRADYVSLATKLPEKALVRITYRRGNKQRRTSYRLGSYQAYLEKVGATRKARPLPPHQRGYLGIRWLEKRGAIVVTQVLEGTGAFKAKLRKDDLITSVAGYPVTTVKELDRALNTHGPDKEVDVTYVRDGKTKSVKVMLCDARQVAELPE